MFGYSITRPVLFAEYYKNIFDKCREFQVPIEAIHTETGPGVYEAAIAYTHALELADRAHLFKMAVKSVGLLHGITPCFMAKPYNNLPGCSGHIHISLKDVLGKNAFQNSTHKEACNVMKMFIAGILKGLPSIQAILAPTVNRYEILCT